MRRSKALPLTSAALGGLVATLAVVLAPPFGTATRTRVLVPSTSGTSFASQIISTAPLTPRQVYAQDAHGVVAIRATTVSGKPSSPPSGERATLKIDSGTGIVLNSSGLIVTNEHVVEGASSITVSLNGQGTHTFKASVVTEDKPSDLALLKVDPGGLALHPLKLADTATPQVGEAAYAIGNPFGLDWTLTTGIVSALHRQISAPDGAAINDVIQTDAPLNPGNSGGPLIDSAGAVIGINSQIVSGSRSATGKAGSSGLGFAIPISVVRALVQRLNLTAS
jgi:putative serine protease PepD